MYFVIGFFVLCIWKFTDSMNWREIQPETQQEDDQEEQLIPFDFEYSDTVNSFLRNKTSDFRLNLEKKLLLEIRAMINSALNLNLEVTYTCRSVETSPGNYEVTEEGSLNCNNKCTWLNLQYVALLNEYISQMKNAFFLGSDQSRCEIKLNPINSNISQCIVRNRNVFECQCNPNYQIMVSKLLKRNTEYNIQYTTDYAETLKIQEYSAFLLLLKYHPLSAVSYLAYLVYVHKLPVSPVFVDIPYPPVQDPNNETHFEGGLIENKGSFLKNDKEIFKWFLKEMNYHACDLRQFGSDCFNHFYPSLLFLILVIFLRKLSEINQ